MLAVRAPDPVMSLLAPVGLASSAGTALIIDVVSRISDRGVRTLSDIVTEGPKLEEISPGRSGIAMIKAGHLGSSDVTQAAAMMASRWPAVVIRVDSDQWPGPVVPVHVLYGGNVDTWDQGAAVWQTLTGGERPPGPGPVIPRVTSRTVRHILNGWTPRPSRWTRSWLKVWDIPWA